MNDLPRQRLCEIVTHRKIVEAQSGRSVLDDPRLCEALLRDLCGEHKREIFVLVSALKERVAADLLASQDGVPREVLLTRLTRRLQDNLALTEEAARWAVDSWTLALGIVAPVESKSRAPQAIAPITVTPPPATSRSQVSTPSHNEMVLTLALGVRLELVRIPAGEFLMGSSNADEEASYDEKPQHKVSLDEYLIGKYPVTVAQFAAFVKATGYTAAATSDVKQKGAHPVTQVSWDDAFAFCQWASQVAGREVRLPTEAEWEKAARGTDGRLWPWGNEPPDKTRCNFGGNVKDTTPVGQYSPGGDSPYRCADMAGNMWEWVADWYAENYYASSPTKNPSGPSSGQYRVLRGGSWYFVASNVRVANRSVDYPVARFDDYGFRCVGSLGFPVVDSTLASFCRHIYGKIFAQCTYLAQNTSSPRQFPESRVGSGPGG